MLNVLVNKLNCDISKAHHFRFRVQHNPNAPDQREVLKTIKFDELTEHFIKTQEKHRKSRRQPRSIQDLEKPYSNT